VKPTPAGVPAIRFGPATKPAVTTQPATRPGAVKPKAPSATKSGMPVAEEEYD
jgi:hypothetical protein